MPSLDSSLPALPHHDGVALHVAHVDALALPLHVWMLPHHEPADVAEEEAAGRIVGISVRVSELVVRPVVADPLVNVILKHDRVTEVVRLG